MIAQSVAKAVLVGLSLLLVLAARLPPPVDYTRLNFHAKHFLHAARNKIRVGVTFPSHTADFDPVFEARMGECKITADYRHG
ncbi:MAG TPA: hypothetical protein VKE29_08590 [Candidatus Udaeobacter sp.]|nr:hypothetical protein [Candidatus Udaeobacter sp.]